MTELAAARDWLTVYQVPPYAHELNPVEPLWSCLKGSLANLGKRNLAQLTAWSRPGSGECSTGPACSKASSPAPASTSPPSVAPTIEIFFAARSGAVVAGATVLGCPALRLWRRACGAGGFPAGPPPSLIAANHVRRRRESRLMEPGPLALAGSTAVANACEAGSRWSR
jgi:hypothetical protein